MINLFQLLGSLVSQWEKHLMYRPAETNSRRLALKVDRDLDPGLRELPLDLSINLVMDTGGEYSISLKTNITKTPQMLQHYEMLTHTTNAVFFFSFKHWK